MRMLERRFGRSDGEEEEKEGGGVARCERLLLLLMGSGDERSRNITIFCLGNVS